MHKNNNLPGLYISVVGLDGSGKTTLVNNLVKQLQEDYPHFEIVTTREPGGTPKAESLRTIIKSKKLPPFREAELFANARASSLREVVRPALQEKKIVIADRCEFCSYAYQGVARGLGIITVEELNKDAVNGVHPDIVVWLNVSPEECAKRLLNTKRDHFDENDLEFFRRITGAYGHILSRWQEKLANMKVINIEDPEGTMSPDKILRHTILKLDPEIWKWEGIEGKFGKER